MIQKLKDAIDMADATNNEKAKKLLLKVAEMREDLQEDTLNLVFMMVKDK